MPPPVPLSTFKNLRWLRLEMRIEAFDPISLEGFVGPTLRGLLGETLHQGSWRGCDGNDPDMESLFHTVFTGPPPRPGTPIHPPPFVIHPPGSSGLHLDRGDSFTFGITLFGDAATKAIDLCWLLFRFGLFDGIGRARSRFLVLDVHAVTPGGPVCLFQGTGGPVARKIPPDWTWNGEQFVTRALEQMPRDVRATRLELTTPLDLRARGRAVTRITFRDLLRSILRNLASHARNHGDGPLDLDFESWKAHADTVASGPDRTWAERVVHYSRRQFDRNGRPRPIRVATRRGTLDFHGELNPFLPFLVLGAAVHIGKGRTMGFGGMELHVEGDA